MFRHDAMRICVVLACALRECVRCPHEQGSSRVRHTLLSFGFGRQTHSLCAPSGGVSGVSNGSAVGPIVGMKNSVMRRRAMRVAAREDTVRRHNSSKRRHGIPSAAGSCTSTMCKAFDYQSYFTYSPSKLASIPLPDVPSDEAPVPLLLPARRHASIVRIARCKCTATAVLFTNCCCPGWEFGDRPSKSARLHGLPLHAIPRTPCRFVREVVHPPLGRMSRNAPRRRKCAVNFPWISSHVGPAARRPGPGAAASTST